MAVLKGYFDESGDDSKNSNLRVTSFAGYIASIATWDTFETLWSAALKEFGAPYFHMREFGQSVEAFASWKNDETKRIEFIRALTNAVNESGSDLAGVCGVVEISDLQRFNSSRSQSIEGYSFCMSTCVMEIIERLWNTSDSVSAICDRIDRPQRRISKAYEYLSNDPYYKDRLHQVTIAPLCGNLSWRDVLPLQLADFGAWEARKSCESKSKWIAETPKEQQKVMNWVRWKHGLPQESNLRGDVRLEVDLRTPRHWTGERHSVVSLIQAAPLQGSFWGYEKLIELDERRGHAWSSDNV